MKCEFQVHYVRALLLGVLLGASCALRCEAQVPWEGCKAIPKYPNGTPSQYWTTYPPPKVPEDVSVQQTRDNLSTVRAWYAANLPGWVFEDHANGDVYPPYWLFRKPNSNLSVTLYSGSPTNSVSFECRGPAP
jgi:hypothetical protein